MAAYDNGIGTVGIAPGAPVYSVRVLDDKNRGTLSTILCGLDWVAANAATYDIRVLNLSLATAGVDDGNCGRTNGDVLHQAICELADQGITVVASAANSTKDLAGARAGLLRRGARRDQRRRLRRPARRPRITAVQRVAAR